MRKKIVFAIMFCNISFAYKDLVAILPCSTTSAKFSIISHFIVVFETGYSWVLTFNSCVGCVWLF